MREGFDVSNPEDQAITGFAVAGGYLGGRTPHPWTPKQWADQPARWRAPFWVYDPSADAVTQAAAAVAAMLQLKAPDGAAIFLDMETLVHPEAVNQFANHVHAHDFVTGVYGSESTVFGNPPRSGYFVAVYDGVRKLYEHPHSIAKQYTDRATVTGGLAADLSVYADSAPLWDTQAPPVTIRPPWAEQAIAKLTQALADVQVARSEITANAK